MTDTRLTITVDGHTEIVEGSMDEVRKKLTEAGKNFRERIAKKYKLPKPEEENK